MKTDMHRVNYDGTPNDQGNWWVWNETCDKCGKHIFGTSVMHSYPQDYSEADFCNDCLRELLDGKIDYNQAREMYKK